MNGWRFNKTVFEYQYAQNNEILVRVSEEEWDNFRRRYGGSYITVRGFNIPVPRLSVYVSQEEQDRQEALMKVLKYMLGEK